MKPSLTKSAAGFASEPNALRGSIAYRADELRIKS